MQKAIIGKKVGMTQIFDESGKVIPVTVFGGLLAYPVARFLVGSPAAAITVYILPFFVSCAGGTILAIVIVTALKKAKVFDRFLGYAKEAEA